MARAARQLAAEGGRLVDDNGRVLDERAIAAIEAQLQAVRHTLVERGIEPGSALAQRLFS
jgi:FtsZ-interacting cell division protein ZipA